MPATMNAPGAQPQVAGPNSGAQMLVNPIVQSLKMIGSAIHAQAKKGAPQAQQQSAAFSNLLKSMVMKQPGQEQPQQQAAPGMQQPAPIQPPAAAIPTTPQGPTPSAEAQQQGQQPQQGPSSMPQQQQQRPGVIPFGQRPGQRPVSKQPVII